MEILLKSKNEEFESFKNEIKFETEDLEKRVKNEAIKYENLKLKYDELLNKDKTNEILILNFKHKEKEFEQIIYSLKQEIFRKTKEQEIVELDNLNLKSKVENLEVELNNLIEKHTSNIKKLNEDFENERM